MPRRALRKRIARVVTTAAVDAAAAAAATAVALRAPRTAAAIASHAPEHQEKGGRVAALFPNGKTLAIEAVVIAALIALVAFLVYHFTVHRIVNHRPLGGANVDISNVDFDQSQAAFAIDPKNSKHLFGASNDTGLEVLRIYESTNGGKTWTRSDGPAVAGGSCVHGNPRVAFGRDGRELLTFLAAPFCGDSLTPYLVVTSRTAGERWAPLARVTRPTWKYGFDDAPDIAVDPRSGHVTLTWTQGISKEAAQTSTSTSADGGKTWSRAMPLWFKLDHPHLTRIAYASNGDEYVTGIDAKLGLWAYRVGQGEPMAAAKIVANPAAGCAQTAGDPLPKELGACEGPDPTISVAGNRVVIVYGDVGAGGSPDVFAVTLTRDLKPISRVQINAPDKKDLQLLPVSTVDPTTGTFWACWYDTTYDPNQHRVWFTCSASKNGRTWSTPVRAAAKPTDANILYGILGKAGAYPSVSARNGVVHVFWADGRVIENSSDIFTAAIPERFALTQRG